MKPILTSPPTALLVRLLVSIADWVQQKSLALWYKQPARDWNDALPVGNGRMGVLQLLPALPSAWKKRHVKGLVARENFEIEMLWANGKGTNAFVASKARGTCKLLAFVPVNVTGSGATPTKRTTSNQPLFLTSLSTAAGKRYQLVTN